MEKVKIVIVIFIDLCQEVYVFAGVYLFVCLFVCLCAI